MTQNNRRGFRIPKLTRDAGVYVVGLFILLHETLIANADRPTLIYAACALLGLPIVMRVDEMRNRNQGGDGGEEEEEDTPPPLPPPRPAPRARKQAGGRA